MKRCRQDNPPSRWRLKKWTVTKGSVRGPGFWLRLEARPSVFSEYDIPSRAARRANCLTTALLKSSYGRDWAGSSRSASGEDGNNSRLSERCEHTTNRLVWGARRRSAAHYLPSSIRAKDPSVFARLGISVARAVRPQSHPRSSRGHMELSDDSRR